jgi:hypothetical protein
MLNCSGTFDVDWIKLQPSQREAELPPAEKAKLDAEKARQAAANKAQELPAGERAHWGEEPVVALGDHRGEIVLNGLWRFTPATVKDPKTAIRAGSAFPRTGTPRTASASWRAGPTGTGST